MNYLIVVDMQADFVSGALGTKEAQAIVPAAAEKIHTFDGQVFYTRDTHEENYLTTQEGKNLPVPHCIRGTEGWQIVPSIRPETEENVIDKPTFGSTALAERLAGEHAASPIGSVTLIGLCTDICVISNALLIKAYLPEVQVIVDAACCAGVTPESHQNALSAMKMCQITVVNGE